MKVSLVDVDGHHFPNLALMKISAWHKQQGDSVDWYSPVFSNPDRIYASKVFTFTPDFQDYAARDPEPIRGGTGYNATVKLPDEIENTAPDYSIYPEYKEAYGFISRGCIRNCQWCVVPKKEGEIRFERHIEDIAGERKTVVLMDNNFLALTETQVARELVFAINRKLVIDFNQGLDARLVTNGNAELLAQCRWIKSKGIRFACDTAEMLPVVKRAIQKVRAAGYRGTFSIYVLAIDPDETLDRVRKLLSVDEKIIPRVQPYRDFSSSAEPSQKLKDIARYYNAMIYKAEPDFKKYKGRK